MIRDSIRVVGPAARSGVAAVVAGCAVMAGCATTPLSFINDGQVTERAQLHRYPVYVDRGRRALDRHSGRCRSRRASIS